MAVSNPLDYALLVGQGRSGTNFLLALLNQSRRTHCRNEPDQSDGSALAALRPYRFFVEDGSALERLWEPALREAALAFGPRDHIVVRPKDWLYPGVRRAGFFYLRSRLLLRARRMGVKAMDVSEVRFPIWMTSPRRLERAFHVFKLNAAVGVGRWALKARPEARILHIVRHPGGFAKSWFSRWVKGRTHQERAATGKDDLRDADRLRVLAGRDPAWARRLGDIDAMGRVESELWWWRYSTEALFEAGRGSANYHRILFEDLATDPLGVIRKVYDACGLDLDGDTAGEVLRISSGSDRIARAWRDELDPSTVGIVERVLDHSPLEGWWAAAA